MIKSGNSSVNCTMSVSVISAFYGVIYKTMCVHVIKVPVYSLPEGRYYKRLLIYKRQYFSIRMPQLLHSIPMFIVSMFIVTIDSRERCSNPTLLITSSQGNKIYSMVMSLKFTTVHRV